MLFTSAVNQWFSISDNIVDLRSDVSTLSTIDSAELTIKTIIKNYPPPYRLMVSGGIDSQAMLFLWKIFGSDYVATAVKYNEDLNDYDLTTLAEFSYRENMSIEYINFDLISFYENDFNKIAEKYKCTSPQFAAHLGMSEKLPGTCIFSGDRILGNKAFITSQNMCLLNASKYRPVIPFFFLNTPEIAYSGNNEKNFLIDDTYSSKISYWQKSKIPVVGQERKFNGFEKIKEYYDKNYLHLVTPNMRLKYSMMPSKRVYDILLRYPYERKFGTIDFKYLVNPT